MHATSAIGWLSRVYLLGLLVLAVAAGAWALDTFVVAGGDRSILLSIAAAAVVFGVLGWAFRRASR